MGPNLDIVSQSKFAAIPTAAQENPPVEQASPVE